MKIDFYDFGVNKIASIYTYVSLVFEESYGTCAPFQLEMVKNEEIMKILRGESYQIEESDDGGFESEEKKQAFYLTVEESDEVGFITSVQIDETRIIVGGFTADYILSKRVSTSVVSNKNAGDAMADLVSGMAPWPNFSSAYDHDIVEKYKKSTSDQSVLQYCEIISQETDVGFKVVKNGRSLVLLPYKPDIDESTAKLFSKKVGNLYDLSFLKNENDYYNVAIVAGQGSGENRVTVIAGGSTVYEDRREMYVDARQEQMEDGETLEEYKNRLIQIGEQALEEKKLVNVSGFSLKENNLSVGEIVYIDLDFPIKQRVAYRVVNKKIISQNNRNEIQVEVGTPIKIVRR